jgi:hypothetical protein
MQIQHILSKSTSASTEEPISIQSRKKNLYDINKASGNIQSRIWIQNKDITKQLAAFERKVLRMSGGN